MENEGWQLDIARECVQVQWQRYDWKDRGWTENMIMSSTLIKGILVQV